MAFKVATKKELKVGRAKHRASKEMFNKDSKKGSSSAFKARKK